MAHLLLVFQDKLHPELSGKRVYYFTERTSPNRKGGTKQA